MASKTNKPSSTVTSTSTSTGSTNVTSTDSNSDVLSDLPPTTNSCAGQTPTLDAFAGGDTRRETYLRAAQDVVTQSNDAGDNDPMWHAFNGGNQGVLKDDPDAKKPEAWLRGLTLQDQGTKTGGLEDYSVGAKHGDTNGIDTIVEFREMMKSDLQFNKAFEKFESEQQWLDALQEQYCKDLPADDPQRKKVDAIGHNLWCYQTTGADANGKTDIAQFQGLLYALDSLLAEASQSNTPHKGKFTIPGSDIELDTLGDGAYGRATILEARLLAAIVEKPEVKIPKEEAETYLILDASGSMKDKYEHITQVMDSIEFGQTTVGAMTGFNTDVQWDDRGERSSADVRQTLIDLSDPDKNPEEVEPALQGMLGAAASESSIRKAIELLRDDERFAGPPPEHTKRQIVVATDEYDWKPQELGELRQLAIDKKVDVKVVFMMEDGLFEISVNAISDKTIDLITTDLDGAHTQGYVTTKLPDEEKEDPHDQREHLRLDWEKIATEQGVVKTPYK